LQATPTEGYLFHRWRGENCKETSKCVLTLNGNTQINAAFTMVIYATNQGAGGLNSRNLFLATTDGTFNDKITASNTGAYLQMDQIKFSPDGEKILYRKTTTDITK